MLDNNLWAVAISQTNWHDKSKDLLTNAKKYLFHCEYNNLSPVSILKFSRSKNDWILAKFPQRNIKGWRKIYLIQRFFTSGWRKGERSDLKVQQTLYFIFVFVPWQPLTNAKQYHPLCSFIHSSIHSSSLLLVGHKAATILLQLIQSCAAFSTPPLVRPISFSSDITVLCHIITCFTHFLLSVGVHLRTTLRI